MKIEMRTDVCNLIQPDSYGTEFCYEVKEGKLDEFWETAKSVGQRYLNEMMADTRHFSDAKVTVTGVWSPREYNFQTDSLEFDLEFGNRVVQRIVEDYYGDEMFLKYIKNTFGSRNGFASFYPYEPEKFFAALTKNPNDDYDFERAISMVISYEVDEMHDIEDWQKDYIDDWYAAMREDGDILIVDENEDED